MHPPLHRPHPDCQEIISKLISCHEDNKISKFFGACNDFKAEMDWCFKTEKEAVRKENLRKSKLRSARFEALSKKLQVIVITIIIIIIIIIIIMIIIIIIILLQENENKKA